MPEKQRPTSRRSVTPVATRSTPEVVRSASSGGRRLGPISARSVPAGWARFAQRLRDTLTAMPNGRYLILTVHGQQRFVQFATGPRGDTRAECVSDVYLADDDKLSARQRTSLTRLGWHAPTRTSDDDKEPGSTNWWQDIKMPADAEATSLLAVRTLAEVYSLKTPASLQYKAWAKKGAVPWDVPALGLEREVSDKTLTPRATRVCDALEEVADDGVAYTTDNVMLLNVLDVGLTVVVMDDLPIARIIAIIEGNVRNTAALRERINDVNAQHLEFGYTYWRDGEIRYGVEVVIEPFSRKVFATTAVLAALAVQQIRTERTGKPKRTRGTKRPAMRHGKARSAS